MKTRIILAALFFTTLISACKKDKPDLTENAAELLQNKDWKIVSLTIHPAYYGITDALSTWDACDLDDLHRFNPDYVYVLNSGAELCYTGEEQEQTGFWSYTDATKMLSFSLQPYGDNYTLTLRQISENHFVAFDKLVEDGVEYTGTWEFEKQ